MSRIVLKNEQFFTYLYLKQIITLNRKSSQPALTLRNRCHVSSSDSETCFMTEYAFIFLRYFYAFCLILLSPPTRNCFFFFSKDKCNNIF